MAEWLVVLRADPQSVHQDGELASDGDDCALLGVFPPALGNALAESAQVTVLAEGTQDVLGALRE